MGISLTEHVILFLTAALLGMVLGAVYDFGRVLRAYFGNGRAFVFILDVFFWIIAAVATYWFFLVFNEGKIRVPVLIAEAGGAGLWYVTIGKAVIKRVRASSERVKKRVRVVAAAAAKPVKKYSTAAGKEIFQKTKTVGSLFKKDCKDFKIRLKVRGNMMYNLLQLKKKPKSQNNKDE